MAGKTSHSRFTSHVSQFPTPDTRFPNPNSRIAIVHYWLDSYRGGEKVVEALCEMFPKADIYTHVYKPEKLPGTITSHKVFTTFISKLPFAKRFYRHYLPLMPLATYLLNLKKYDLIISSESGPAKCIRKRKDSLHVCYCHSPMRYIWDMEAEYIDSLKSKVSQVSGIGNGESSDMRCEGSGDRESESRNINYYVSCLTFHVSHFMSHISHLTFHASRFTLFKYFWEITACYMRCWDRFSAKKVDYFIANSRFVAARIRKFYRRKSITIHPPVDNGKFSAIMKRDDFYLCVSELVSYKKVDLVVRAFNELSLPLVVIGGGSDFGYINRIAKDNIRVLGKVSDKILKEKFEKCKAFVYAGKEDFGIIFPEALSAGAPIIAYRKGGVRDVVRNGKKRIVF